MTVQTILTVIAWVFSVIAISVAFSAKENANNNSFWSDIANKRIHERINVIARDNRDLQGQHRALSKRVDDLENQLAEEKDCEPCRPRSYVTLVEVDGKNLVVLPERKKDLFKEDFKPHKVDEYCVGCNNLIALDGTKPACALDRKCKDFEAYGK